jgi:hypothetical protein
MRSRSAFPAAPLGSVSDPFETDRSQQWHPHRGQFDGKSDPEQNAPTIFTV